MSRVIVNTDGGSRGNPGPGAVGFVVYENDKEIYKKGKCIGHTTNNQAEYMAVLEALCFLEKDEKDKKEIIFRVDSELVVKQLNGEYKVKDRELKSLFLKIREKIIGSGLNVSFVHVRREQNKVADSLVNQALDNSQ
jgi:ribonuclease HI